MGWYEAIDPRNGNPYYYNYLTRKSVSTIAEAHGRLPESPEEGRGVKVDFKTRKGSEDYAQVTPLPGPPPGPPPPIDEGSKSTSSAPR